MEKLQIKTLHDIGYYQGPGAIPGIKFRTAGKDLGVKAWGMNVLEINRGCEEYPEHDHLADGQEEVYVVLRGSGQLLVDGKEVPLAVGTFVRVTPELKRKILPGVDGITVLALGGTPGQAYPQK